MTQEGGLPVARPPRGPKWWQSQLTSTGLMGAMALALVGAVVGPAVSAAISGDATDVNCVELVQTYRGDLQGHPERLGDYLDKGTDGRSVIQADARAKACSIDAGDLEKWSQEAAPRQ